MLFGFPDLYDTDNTSEGIGNWCLMGGGSWNGGGDIPAHPSAWCKVNQGWVSVTNVTAGGSVTLPDVKTSRNVQRLWKDGGSGSEYFLIENRQRTGYDARLPGDGLLVWHVDENQPGNTDENHYKVGLLQADGKRDLELKRNRGDAGDAFPGSSSKTSVTSSTTPNTKSFTGQDTCLSLTGISPSAPTMTVTVSVTCGKAAVKDHKDGVKDNAKDVKDKDGKEDFPKEVGKDVKDVKDVKDGVKDNIKDVKDKDGKELPKEVGKDVKDVKDVKDGVKDNIKDVKDKDGKELPKEAIKEIKEQAKEFKDRIEKQFDRPPGGDPWASGGDPWASDRPDLESRVAALEALLAGLGSAEPFIGADIRPSSPVRRRRSHQPT